MDIPISLLAGIVSLFAAGALIFIGVFLVNTPHYMVRVGSRVLIVTLDRKRYRQFIEYMDAMDPSVIFEVRRLTEK